jgi:hypothetical protein
MLVKTAVRPQYDLAELAARIPKGCKAKEVDLGRPAGKQTW